MVPHHVRTGISNEMPDESMARLVYPIKYRMKALPANTAQNTYKLARRFGAFFFEDVEKKVGLKSPKLHTPR